MVRDRDKIYFSEINYRPVGTVLRSHKEERGVPGRMRLLNTSFSRRLSVEPLAVGCVAIYRNGQKTVERQAAVLCVTLLINCRGSPGKGTAYRCSSFKNWALTSTKRKMMMNQGTQNFQGGRLVYSDWSTRGVCD